MYTPGPDMWSKSNYQKNTVTAPGTERPQCPGVGPAPLFQVELGIAKTRGSPVVPEVVNRLQPRSFQSASLWVV